MPAPLTQPEIDHWQRVLAAASKLQEAIPEAFLVGGSAVGIHAPYRTSRDAERLVPDLYTNWEEVLDGLKALAGWSTEVVRERHTIMGRLDGIETTLMNDDRVRQGDTLDIQTYSLQGLTLRLPTMAKMLRIKSYLLMIPQHGPRLCRLQRTGQQDARSLFVSILGTLGTPPQDASTCRLVTRRNTDTPVLSA